MPASCVGCVVGRRVGLAGVVGPRRHLDLLRAADGHWAPGKQRTTRGGGPGRPWRALDDAPSLAFQDDRCEVWREPRVIASSTSHPSIHPDIATALRCADGTSAPGPPVAREPTWTSMAAGGCRGAPAAAGAALQPRGDGGAAGGLAALRGSVRSRGRRPRDHAAADNEERPPLGGGRSGGWCAGPGPAPGSDRAATRPAAPGDHADHEDDEDRADDRDDDRADVEWRRRSAWC